MTLDWLLGWYNLIYVLPFGVALLYLLLYAASGVTFGEADADLAADGGADGDFSANGDLAGHIDANADGDFHHHHHAGGAPDHLAGGVDSDHAGAAPAETGLFKTALIWLGVGRVPLSILLMVLFITWGVTGFTVNHFVRPTVGADWSVVLYSLPAAFVAAVLVTRVVVRVIDRWLPLDETTARRRHDLLGFAGVAMYDITDRFGMLSVRDDRGELHQVPCRVQPGGKTIVKNGRAVLVGYNARRNLFEVMPEEAVGATADGQSRGA